MPPLGFPFTEIRSFFAAQPASAVCYLSAYAVGLLAFAWFATRRKLSTRGVWSVAVAGLIGGLLGAAAVQWVVSGGGTYTAAKTVLGGVIGGYLTVHLYKRWIGLKRPLGDLFAVGLSAGEAVGRWGCFFGGCCYGKAVSGSVWFAVFQHDAYRHPAQLYLSGACVLILGILLACEFVLHPPENTLFYLQGALYSVARFVVEFYREGKVLALGLTTAQWGCLGLYIFFTALLVRLLRRARLGIPVAEGQTAQVVP